MLISTNAAAPDYRRDLGDGLVLRWSQAEDTEQIAQFVGRIFRSKEDAPDNIFLANLVRDLMSGRTTVMGENDYGVIQDTSKEGKPIVATVCLQRQTWLYEGIPFVLGRPEIVASEPAYRKRGLVRSIFEMVHARSEAEGHLVQGITGIPYFYRQFGYEYALDLEGYRGVALHGIPKLKEGEQESYTLREATGKDLPVVRELYHHLCARYMVSVQMSDEFLRYLIDGWQDNDQHYRVVTTQLILDSKQTIIGMLHALAGRWGKRVVVVSLATAPGVNQQAMVPSLLRALETYGQALPMLKADTDPFSEIQFALGREHPIYEALGKSLITSGEPPYAWYLRVPDLARFIKHIAPALEKRLVDSPVAGYSGDLKLNFYRDGLRLVFEQGRLTGAEPWRAPLYAPQDNSDGGFPPKVFLQALFGYRSLDELKYAYPDVWVTNATLFNTLFPKKASWATQLP